MSSVVRSVLGAALLLAGASAAMAASDKPPVGDSRQTGATTATVGATNAAPVADKSAQSGAATATVGATNAPAVDQAKKARNPSVPDNNAANSGSDPNSTAAMRAFFTPQY